MDAVLNGPSVAKPEVSDRKRVSSHSEPPVLSRCEDPVAADDSEPCSSPPSLRRETYVTRQRSSNVKSCSVYRFSLLRNDRSALDRRNGAPAGFGNIALRRLNRRKRQKQRKQLRSNKNALLGPVVQAEGRTTRSRTATSVFSTPSCENSVSSVDIEVTPGTSRTLRPRKSDVGSPAPPFEIVKPPKLSPVHLLKEVFAKDKPCPEEVDLVDGIEILGFSSLDDLQKYTEAEEALRGPVPTSDEEIDVEYYSDFEEDPTSTSAIVLSESSRMSLFDSSDGEVDRSASRNDDWNMKDLGVDEASCSSSKHTTSGRRSRNQDKEEMPKVGQILDLGLGRPLRPESARNVHRLLDQPGGLSRKLAEFSMSVVTQKGKPVPRVRMVMPVVCPKLLEIMKYRWAIGDHGEEVTLSTAKTKADVPKPGTSASGGSNFSQLMKLLTEPGTSQSGERPKRKPELPLRGRPRKRTRKSRESSAVKAASDNKGDSDVEVIEVKKVDEVKTKKDSSRTVASASEADVTKIEKPLAEVENIVREIVDFVTLRMQEHPIPFDPDQSEGPAGLEEEKSVPPTIAPAQKKTRAGLLCELRRLDVTVFDMDEEAANEPPPAESTSVEENCKKESCRFGCVCESLAGRRAAMPTHCGRVDCMFECSCTSISYERKPGGRHLLDVSDATLAWIQDESERNLAKVERQFKQTVVRAKDDLIVMGSKRSRREIKMPERYRENFITNKDSYLLYEIEKMKRKSSTTTLTPPLTPTNKSLSPTKLITPPKGPVSKPTPPQRPRFGESSEYPRPKWAKIPHRKTTWESSDDDTDSEDEIKFSSQIRPCSVLLYRIRPDEILRPRRNVAVKSTSKIRHIHNINQSSARTSCKFIENRLESKKTENKLTSLWKQHSADNEMFCHIVKEHSISPEEWEKSGELAAADEPMSPLKKNTNSVQLIPWTFLRDKFKSGEYHIWYKQQQGNNKQKLYLTDGPAKPNKNCINLRAVQDPDSAGLPPMIAKLVTTNEIPEDVDKDARCFLKSLGDYWLVAGYMQRTAGGASSTGMPETSNVVPKRRPSMTKTSEEDVVEIEDPRSVCKNRVKAQARWWLLHLTRTFDMLLFRHLGVSVKYEQIKKTASLANKDQSGAFIRMSLHKNSTSKFGVYGVPGMRDCVLIGPYALDQQPGFTAYSQSSSSMKKHYVRVPIYCANKDSEYELESRKIATPEWLLRIPKRVIGTWLYDFKSLEIPRPGSIPDKHQESRVSEEAVDNNSFYASSELKSLLEKKTTPPLPRLTGPGSTLASRMKSRAGQSLLKGADEVKAINKNTLSVRIDGKGKEALVHVEEGTGVQLPAKEETKQTKLKIRKDLIRVASPPPAPVPEIRPSSTSSSEKSPAGSDIDLEDDAEASESRPHKKHPKRDYIVSNIKNLGYIPVTYVSPTSVFIPHFTVPGQVHFFRTHDELVKYVHQAVRQKIAFIGTRAELISWRQVDSLEDVNGEKQFNPGVLVGNHVITKAGLVNLVKLTEEEIPALNLNPKDAEKLTAKLDHIKSLPLLRQLARLVVGPKAGPMPQNAIVFLAVTEIQKLVAQSSVLKNYRKGLLDEQRKIEDKLKELMAGLPEDLRLKAQNHISTIRTEKPVIVLDEESENEEKNVPAAAPSKKFAVSEMVNLTSDEDEEGPPGDLPLKTQKQTDTTGPIKPVIVLDEESENEKEDVPAVVFKDKLTVKKMVNLSSDDELEEECIPTVADKQVSSEALTTPTTSSETNTTPNTSRPSQSLICKFPFSPLKRVNVTVKEDGIVATSSTNTMIQINPPVRTISRSADGSLFKTIKLVDPKSFKKITSCPTIIRAPVTAGQSIIRPNLNASTSAMPSKIIPKTFPLLRAMSRPGLPAGSDIRPRTVLMTRAGSAVPMSMVRPKAGEPFVKLVSPKNDKVFITSSLPVVKSGLKVLHPNIPANQRLSSPPKTNVIRILKPVTSTATGDNTVKVLLSPKKVTAPSLPAMPPVIGAAEIDTTELVID